MAHYIAELIASAEANPDKPEAQRECAQAILQLWEYRSTFPGPNPPLASFEPIARALERLDPEHINWGYFDAYRPRVQPNSKLNVAAVELALTLDRSLGGVIRFLLREATVEAVSAERKWLDPKELGTDEDRSIVSSIIEGIGYGTSESKTADAIRSVESVRAALDQIAENLRDRTAR